MFDWSKEENDDFYYKNIERIAKRLKTLPNAQNIIEKLKKDGHEIYIISSRDNGEYTNPKEMTEKWLKDNNIYYDKLILVNKGEKGDTCIDNNIDIMIDDNVKNCIDVSGKGIKVLMMRTKFNQNITQFEQVLDWEDIYKKINKANI